MFRPIVGLAATLMVLLAGTAVFAQGVITDVKTPPLQASDIFKLPIDFHPGGPSPPWAGWAGSRMKMHIQDAGEMDVVGLTPVASGAGSRTPTGTGLPTGPFIPSPFGPASNNSQSVAKFFTAWHPLAQASGINIQPSINQPIFDLTVHVKNSDPAGNSDVDATFMFWNIWHIRETPGSTFVTLRPTDYVLVPSFIQDQQQLHVQGQSFYQFPTNPAHPGTGHWLHLTETAVFHLIGIPSQFYATFANTAFLGIEHIPEPSSAVLLGLGFACTGLGGWYRRRRRQAGA